MEQDIDLTPAEIQELLPESTSDSPVTLDILVTGYSGGAETIRITDQGITEGTRDGYVRLLVKVRRNGRLRDAFYMESAGKDREEIKRNLKEALSKRFMTGR